MRRLSAVFKADNLADPLAVAACAKHYLADGGTAYGSVNRTTAWLGPGRHAFATRRPCARSFCRAIVTTVHAGVGTIMPSYSSWNGVKCSANKHLLTDILKNELGFEGFLISDYNAIDQESRRIYKKDIENPSTPAWTWSCSPTNTPIIALKLKELVNEGKVPLSRIDDAVTRILRVKFALGLMDPKRRAAGRPEFVEISLVQPNIARWPARPFVNPWCCSRTITTCCRLSKKGGPHSCGRRGADNLAMQCGGWTINWQGAMTNQIPGGTTILEAIKNTVSKDTKVTYSKDGTGAEGADVAVVVLGEKPYAEYEGDSVNLSLAPENFQTLANVKRAGVPTAVILLSGRPVILGAILDQADALLAAWLPGSEGQGVADVLFGDYSPTGKLSHSWPRSVSQLPLNAGDKDYDPLFKLGYQLSYGKK